MKTSGFLLKYRGLVVPAVLALSFTLVSCNSDVQEEREDLMEEQHDVREAQREGADAETIMREKRDVYKQEINLRIAKLDSTMDVMEDRADNAKGRVKQQYEATIAVLKQRRDALEDRLDAIPSATEQTWEDTKTTVDTVLANVEVEYNKALESMKTK
jgi:hypothetical protein